MHKIQSELAFEQEVIEYLTKIGNVKQWEYAKDIKDTQGLWDNFKRIIEQNNTARLEEPLSKSEFAQIKEQIRNLKTPYQAGQFLYGTNGVSEISINLDKGGSTTLLIFDQEQIGVGNTVYQVVNQIKRPAVIEGKNDRRFDVTLLINGLPIIQIELKKATNTVTDSLNQMEQYIAENQYSGIFSTLQVLVAMTPNDIKYMANTTAGNFNRDFAFSWQDEETSKPVNDWRTFADKVLSIPMAHNIATQYMILDGTKDRESIKVMRPYQVYATKRIIDTIRRSNFNYHDGKFGYIWHTTGSGKTITSFKTAWLASRLPNVSKVIFLVDRIALTRQTADKYSAYDPTSSDSGVVSDTKNVTDLKNKLLKRTDKNIIVTSIQKMARYVKSPDFKELDGNILFIVDEAHRSTGDGADNEAMLEVIRNKIPNSGWIGYTGTPKFPQTQNTFGRLLHAYTIKEAIADRNVLGFNVVFRETIKVSENREEYDSKTKTAIYDKSNEHLELVVEDIFKYWQERSAERRYNAILTVHVGGGGVSTPRAMQYFDKFEEINETLPPEERLKVAVSFSMDTSNGDNQLQTNQNLARAIKSYNKLFNENFDMTTVKEYAESVQDRLSKNSEDGKYLDLVIVVDQLLTGFDAPELNTLYVDRTLKGSSLIQAYSRTNRVHNFNHKPFGNIINYRWPELNKAEMEEALSVYSNRDSANVNGIQLSLTDSGVLSKPFSSVVQELKDVITELRTQTEDFNYLSPSEAVQDATFENLKKYSSLLNAAKQYTAGNVDGEEIISVDKDPELFYKTIGITKDEEVRLTTVIANDLKRRRSKAEGIDVSHIELEMAHIHNVRVNYDYLTDLIARMANAVHEKNLETAERLEEEIHRELEKAENEQDRIKFRDFVRKIIKGQYKFNKYPAPNNREEVIEALNESQEQTANSKIDNFIARWGIGENTTNLELTQMINKHRVGSREDLNKQNELNKIMNRNKMNYQTNQNAELAQLKWIEWRNRFTDEIYNLADQIVRDK